MNRSPEDFINGMNNALDRGDFTQAEKISVEAFKHYPEHQEIKKYARILAPPKITFHKLPPDPDTPLNQDWVMQHRTDYHGRWVALRSGKLVADASSADELFEKVGKEKMKDVFFTVVY
ncbi:MAG: hypothetical protein AB4426_11845 [Xenococcaceae cyanobacterium]